MRRHINGRYAFLSLARLLDEISSGFVWECEVNKHKSFYLRRIQDYMNIWLLHIKSYTLGTLQAG